ncbi:MAG: hypothetical protein ABI203_01745 [Mucilaginibacter sp.]
MIKKALNTVIMVMAFVSFCFAQDITGNWKGVVNGQFEINYTFKVDGEKLTGSSKGPDGSDSPISNGVIKGDDLSFTIDIMGNDTKVVGKIKGETVSLSFAVNGENVTLDLAKVK